MKKLIFVATFFFLLQFVKAQTNTFPSSGNVGIGTLTPDSKLQIGRDGTASSGVGLRITGDRSTDENLIQLWNTKNSSVGDFQYLSYATRTSTGSSSATIARIGSILEYTGSRNYNLKGALVFQTGGSSASGVYQLAEKMRISSNGNVGIGTTSPSEKLVVNGKILATEIEVVSSISSDFVFEDDYKLRSLEEVEQYVKENKHLPEIPSAAEFAEKGQNLAEMDDLLLRKIEELTLYVIVLKKEIVEIRKELHSNNN